MVWVEHLWPVVLYGAYSRNTWRLRHCGIPHYLWGLAKCQSQFRVDILLNTLISIILECFWSLLAKQMFLFLAKFHGIRMQRSMLFWRDEAFLLHKRNLRILQWFAKDIVVIRVLKMKKDYWNEARLISAGYYSESYFH